MTTWNANKRPGAQSATESKEMLRRYIRDVKDFPKPGVLFKDITPLLQNGKVFSDAIEMMAAEFRHSEVSAIACVESRGFIIGTALAGKLGCGVIPVRKKGKLPYKVCSETYDLEYGTDCLEIHADALDPAQRILIVDDVLATGGTARAVVNLVEGMQGTIVCAAFLLEITALNGRSKLEGHPVYSLLQY